MTVDDAAQLLGISRSSAYVLTSRYRDSAGTDGIPNRRFGGRVLVLTAPLLAMLRTEAAADVFDLGQAVPSAAHLE
jgi:hypothetical protein